MMFEIYRCDEDQWELQVSDCVAIVLSKIKRKWLEVNRYRSRKCDQKVVTTLSADLLRLLLQSGFLFGSL